MIVKRREVYNLSFKPNLKLSITNSLDLQLTLFWAIVTRLKKEKSSEITSSLQRIQSPPKLRLRKRIENTHLRNYYNLKGKYIDVHFLF